jgi:hypothetical protein
MGQPLPADDPDALFWRRSFQPIEDEQAAATPPCLTSDGRDYVFAQKLNGTWFRLEGGSDGNPAEPLAARFRFYRRLAAFAPLIAAALLAGCAALDALGLCPIHSWVG